MHLNLHQRKRLRVYRTSYCGLRVNDSARRKPMVDAADLFYRTADKKVVSVLIESSLIESLSRPRFAVDDEMDAAVDALVETVLLQGRARSRFTKGNADDCT